jgi:hypothetical protein
VDLDLATRLADAYTDAVRELARHWPDDDGNCAGCPGRPYPCRGEHAAKRAVVAAETTWRREAQRMEGTR